MTEPQPSASQPPETKSPEAKSPAVIKASAKADKCRLLHADLTVAICADTREAGCAKASELQASWKHLKKRAKALGRERGVRIAAIPTRCVDVCKFGPLMTVQPGGRWYGDCTPDAIDAILDAHLDGTDPPAGHELSVDH